MRTRRGGRLGRIMVGMPDPNPAAAVGGWAAEKMTRGLLNWGAAYGADRVAEVAEKRAAQKAPPMPSLADGLGGEFKLDVTKPLPPLDKDHPLGSAFAPYAREAAEKRRADLLARQTPAGPAAPVGSESAGAPAADLPQLQVPPRLFSDVIGCEHEKAVLRQVIASQADWAHGVTPLHALLEGPPASAKSMMQVDVSQAFPGQSMLVSAGSIRPAGLRKLVIENPNVRILLVEEMEKSDQEVQDAFLEIMDGRVSRLVATKDPVQMQVDIRVIASCNSSARLSPPLLSRFIHLTMKPYSVAERKTIIRDRLTKRGLAAKDAAAIADLVAPRNADIRDADQIATVWTSDRTLATQMISRLPGSAGPTAVVGTAPRPAAASSHTGTSGVKVTDKRAR